MRNTREKLGTAWRRGSRPGVALAPVLGALLLAVGCGGDTATAPNRGFVRVLVTDSEVGPLEDQSVTITPGGIEQRTSAEGIALFRLAPGEYFVDAHLCCVGPGLRDYHEPVTVAADDTVQVEMQACLSCD